MSRRHEVLASTDSSAYASLRARPASRTERFALGKSLRKDVPRRSLARWRPPQLRPDPVALVQASHVGRTDRLVPVRVARMASSPYGFLRGSAVVMAWDCAHLPATGISPVVCGDAHLGNFGFYASPEGELVIDLNDFDEAHPGAWEWDLRRLTPPSTSRAARTGWGSPSARPPCAAAWSPTATRSPTSPSSRC